MENQLISPFIQSTLKVLQTMAATEPHVGQPSVKQSSQTWGDITGIIGMAGSGSNGTMIISFDEASILAIVNRMLSENYKTITGEVVDAVGEITNIICGSTKAALENENFKFEMATPLMITGKGIEIKQLCKGEIIVIPFSTEEGGFVIEANLNRNIK